MLLRKFRKFVDISLGAFIVSSLSLLTVPLIKFSRNQNITIPSFIVAVIFWISVIIGFIFHFKANKVCNEIEEKLKKKNSTVFQQKRPGIITFFSNSAAKITDSIMIIVAVATVVLIIFNIQIEWLFISFLVVLVLSVVFHSFVNSKNYKYLTAYKKFLEEKERRNNE